MQACATLSIRQASHRATQLRLQRYFQSSAHTCTESPSNGSHTKHGSLGRVEERIPDVGRIKKNGPRGSRDLPVSPFIRKALKNRKKKLLKDPLPGEDLFTHEGVGSHDTGFRMGQESNTERDRRARTLPQSQVRGERDVFVKRGRPVPFNLRIKAAPFSTRFEMNPFAHALATPVREDNFTGLHLPNSCLLPFHMISAGPDTEEQALLPTFLATELIPSKKAVKNLTEEELRLREEWVEESKSARQVFGGSYVINSKAAISFISGKSDRRVPSMVLSRRIFASMGNKMVARHMSWRNDMPDFVLSAMRKVVMKKVSFFFRNKGNKDLPGLVSATPRDDLQQLDDIDDVGCVLRLKPGPGPEEIEAEDDASEYHHQLAKSPPPPEDSDDWESNLPSRVDPEPRIDKITHPEPSSDDGTRSPQVSLREQSNSWWDGVDPLQRHTRPLPPPRKPMTVHYPSVRYRKRRIPVYDLGELLGESGTEELVKGTVFEGVKYMTMAQALGTVQAHLWLLRLQDYMAREIAAPVEMSDDE